MCVSGLTGGKGLALKDRCARGPHRRALLHKVNETHTMPLSSGHLGCHLIMPLVLDSANRSVQPAAQGHAEDLVRPGCDPRCGTPCKSRSGEKDAVLVSPARLFALSAPESWCRVSMASCGPSPWHAHVLCSLT